MLLPEQKAYTDVLLSVTPSLASKELSAVPSRLHRLRRELAQLLRLSSPIVAAQISQSAMGFVDTLMAGRVGAGELAAVAMGSSLWFPLFLFMLGVLMAVPPSVAHLQGAGRQRDIGDHVRQALLIALALAALIFLALRNMAPVLARMAVPEADALRTLAYLEGVSWGMPAIALFFVLRHFSEGLSVSRPSMLIGFAGLFVNVCANYVLIYGKLGFPALGGVGCGWATALAFWVMALGMLVTVRRGRIYQNSRLFEAWPRLRPSEALRILKLGVPIGCSIFVEASVFALIALLLGSLGAETVASHQISLSFASMVFMVPMSIASGISVRVGHALGRGEPTGARRSALSGMGLTAAFSLVSASLSFVFADEVAALYTNQPQVAALAASILRLGALFQFSDAIQVSAAGALRGYKDTRVPMLLVIVAYWGLGLPLGYSLGLTDLWGEPRGAAGFWMGLIAGLSCAALLLGLRLRRVMAKHQRTVDERG